MKTSHGGCYLARLVDLILCALPSLPRWYARRTSDIRLMSKSDPTGMPECKENFLSRVYNGRIHCSCATSRYDAEEADPSRRSYDRPSASAPRGAPTASDHVLMYPIQQQGETSGTRLPASHFATERSLGPHVPQVPSDSGRSRPSYSWPPPSSPVDPTTPPQSARSSLPWSPSGATYHEPGPSTEHESYYSQPQEHHPSASPNVNQQRELYYSHQYARTGAPGWSLRTPNSPVSAQRRHSSAQPLGSITQTQNQNQSSYGPPYMESHRRGEYDGPSPRGA
jgi:hypothetical protein